MRIHIRVHSCLYTHACTSTWTLQRPFFYSDKTKHKNEPCALPFFRIPISTAECFRSSVLWTQRGIVVVVVVSCSSRSRSSSSSRCCCWWWWLWWCFCCCCHQQLLFPCGLRECGFAHLAVAGWLRRVWIGSGSKLNWFLVWTIFYFPIYWE